MVVRVAHRLTGYSMRLLVGSAVTPNLPIAACNTTRTHGGASAHRRYRNLRLSTRSTRRPVVSGCAPAPASQAAADVPGRPFTIPPRLVLPPLPCRGASGSAPSRSRQLLASRWPAAGQSSGIERRLLRHKRASPRHPPLVPLRLRQQLTQRRPRRAG